MPFSTDRAGGAADTAVMIRAQGMQMTTPRIDLMLRELDCDPSHQFFSTLFGIIGLGKASAKAQPEQLPLPLSLLSNAPAR